MSDQLKSASHAVFKTDLKKFMKCLIRGVDERAIKVELNSEVTAELVKAISPDFLFAALNL